MMLAALLASIQVPAPPVTPPTLPPTDWTQLPVLRWKLPPRTADTTDRFVRGEVVAGRCGAGQRSSHGAALRIDVAVLATPTGRVRAIVPRAVDCPTVEQYTVGLIQRMALDNIDTAGQAGDTWYRAGMTYSWSE